MLGKVVSITISFITVSGWLLDWCRRLLGTRFGTESALILAAYYELSGGRSVIVVRRLNCIPRRGLCGWAIKDIICWYAHRLLADHGLAFWLSRLRRRRGVRFLIALVAVITLIVTLIVTVIISSVMARHAPLAVFTVLAPWG